MAKFEKYIKNEVETKKKLGGGSQKQVYSHPENPKKIIGIYKDDPFFLYEKTPEFIKAKFYLTKILHLLFPKNIPDTSMATTKPVTATRDRIEIKKERVAQNKIGELNKIKRELDSLGINYDFTPENFIEDNSGNVVYLDDLPPWGMAGMRRYNPNAIKALIQNKLNGQNQEKALNYLNRLEELYKEFSKGHYE